MIIFWLCFFIFFLILAIKRLDWALMLTIILLPAYLVRFNIWGLPTTALELMILISAGVWVAKNFKTAWAGARLRLSGKAKNQRYPFDWEIVALLLISLLAVGISGFSNSALGLWRAYFFEPILFYLIVINVLGQSKDLGKIIWPLSVSALGVSLIAWYQQFIDLTFLNPIWSLQMRATSIFPYSNAVGLYLAPITLIILGWLLAKEASWRRGGQKAWLKIIYLLVVILASWGAIFFARSEGALIGLVGALAVMGFLAGKKSAIATMIILAALGSLIYLTPTLKNYAWEKANFRDLSGEIRKLQWRETGQMLAVNNRWLWGAGLAGYKTAVAPWHQEGLFFNRDRDPDFKQKTIDSADYRRTHWQPVEVYLYPHNILLNAWSELGLLGMLLFVWLFVKFFYLGVRLLIQNSKFKIQNSKSKGFKYLILGLLGSVVVIIIHGFVDVPYFKNDLAVLFWLIMAMLGLIKIWNDK
jgi:O-antigen ligase